jgi:2-methylcitrate dehydratase PrpD
MADPDALTRDLGERWTVPDLFYKPYPANHFTHAAIDCALALRSRVDVAAIEEIVVGVAGPTLRTIAEPRESKAKPATGYQAQFSGPFTVAAAFVGGSGLGLGFDDVSDERVADRRCLALAARVRCVADPRCDEIFPHQFPATMKVRLADGTELEHAVLANRGGPANPLTPAELQRKFDDNAGRAGFGAAARRVAEALGRLDRQSSLAFLGSLAGGVSPQADGVSGG